LKDCRALHGPNPLCKKQNGKSKTEKAKRKKQNGKSKTEIILWKYTLLINLK